MARSLSPTQQACERCGPANVAWHAGLHADHVWTNVDCPAYLTENGDDCTCNS